MSGFCCTHLNFSAFAHIDCECICLVHALWPVLTECIYLVHSLWPVLTECIYLVHSLWPVLSVSTWSIHCDLYWLWMYLPGPFILTSADCEWICLVHSLWPVLTVNVSTWSIHTDLYWLCSVSQVYQPGPFAMTCTGYEFIYRVHSLWPVLTEFIYLVHPLWPVLSASTWSIHFDLYWLWVYLPGPFTLTCTDCECIYLVRFDLYWLWVYLPGSLWPGLTVSVSTWFTLTWTDCECIYLVHFDLDWLWVYLPGSLWPVLTVSVSTWFSLTCTDCACIYLVQTYLLGAAAHDRSILLYDMRGSAPLRKVSLTDHTLVSVAYDQPNIKEEQCLTGVSVPQLSRQLESGVQQVEGLSKFPISPVKVRKVLSFLLLIDQIPQNFLEWYETYKSLKA